MSDLPYQSPISISHIDRPIISCHSATRGQILSLCNLGSTWGQPGVNLRSSCTALPRVLLARAKAKWHCPRLLKTEDLDAGRARRVNHLAAPLCGTRYDDVRCDHTVRKCRAMREGGIVYRYTISKWLDATGVGDWNVCRYAMRRRRHMCTGTPCTNSHTGPGLTASIVRPADPPTAHR